MIVVLTACWVVAAPGSTMSFRGDSSPHAGEQSAAAPRLAQLEGHVTRTDSAAPVTGATIQLIPTDGRQSRVTNTDAGGHYAFTTVETGDYRVTATASHLMTADATVERPAGNGVFVHLGAGDTKDNIDLALVPRSAIVGVVLDDSGLPLQSVNVALAQRRSVAGRFVLFSGNDITGPTDGNGRFRIGDLLPGDYYVLAPAGQFKLNARDASPAPADPSLAFVPTYYPGTDRAAGAGAVRVDAGSDTNNIVFQLMTARLVHLAGTVSDLSGRPVSDARVVLIKTEDGEIKADALSERVDTEQGSFSGSVPAASYVVQAFTAAAFGSTRVSLSPADPDPARIQVTVHPLVHASGRLIFEGGPPLMSQTRIQFIPADFLTGPVGSNAIQPKVTDDGAFRIDGLAWSGRLRVLAPPGWALKSVMLDGRDIADEPHDFQTADVDGLQLIVTNRLGTIRGTVTDERGPATATVVVFAEDSARLAFPSRFIKVIRSAPTGDFQAPGLLAGRYRVIALESDTIDTERLLSLRSFATPVVLAESESVSVSLRLTRR